MNLAIVVAAAVLAAAPAPASASPPDAPYTPWAPYAPAGSQVAPLQAPDDAWRLSLATGVAGRGGGMRLSAARANPVVLLFFAGQADGVWGRSQGQAARLRFRLLTGGERDLYVPSDGEVEGVFAFGRREFRLVVARAEAARQPAVGLAALVQAATLPSFEGTLPFVGELVRVQYYVSPVEAAFVRYHGAAHLAGAPGWPRESEHAVAASAARLRYSVVFAPDLTFSAEGELVKLWRAADLLTAAEAGAGWQAFERTTLFSLSLRWSGYTRRGAEPGTSARASEVLVVAGATLAL